MSVKVTILVSRSTSNRALSQIAPKTGAASAEALTETAARDSTSLPSQLSSCGWYMVTMASPTTISYGQAQPSSSSWAFPGTGPSTTARNTSPVAILAIAFMSTPFGSRKPNTVIRFRGGSGGTDLDSPRLNRMG